MFGSSLPPVVRRRVHVLFTLFVLVLCSGVQVLWFLLCLSSSCVLYALCCQFHWTVNF